MTFLPQTNHVETIELAESVLDVVIARAKAIEAENIRLGRVGTNGNNYDPDESLKKRISGYAGEAALATVLGRGVPSAGDHFQDRPDVAGFDVMTTKRTNGSLIFTPKNKPESVKVLVIDEWPVFHIAGCYQCFEARDHHEWWREPHPGGGAWFVPQAALRPVNRDGDVRPIGDEQHEAAEKFAKMWREAAEFSKELRVPYKRNPTPEEQDDADRKIRVRTAIRRQLEREYVEQDARQQYDQRHEAVATPQGLFVRRLTTQGALIPEGQGEYGATNRATYNPGGLVVRSDVPKHLQTYRPRLVE